jgi:hypothetical protein
MVDQRFELLHTGMPLAPEAEQHCRCGTAAESFGLIEVGNLKRGPAGARSGSGGVGEGQGEEERYKEQRDPASLGDGHHDDDHDQ